MSHKIDVKSNIKSKIITKEKNNLNKLSNNSNNQLPDKFSKNKSKNFNLRAKAQIKSERFNDNKLDGNHSMVIRSNNNLYNINNNISININIDIRKNYHRNINKYNKNKNGMKNKSVEKKNQKSIDKEDDIKNKSLILRDPKHSKINEIKPLKNKKILHPRIQSADFGLNSFKNNYKNKANNTSNNFNITTTESNTKKSDSNKITITSVDDLKVDNKKKRELKKDYTITTNNCQNNRSMKLRKKTGKKRKASSPSINRELLNNKQISILNYSTENRKVKKEKDSMIHDNNIQRKNIKAKKNFKDISTSPFGKSKNNKRNSNNSNKVNNINNNSKDIVNENNNQISDSKNKVTNNNNQNERNNEKAINKTNGNEKKNKSKMKSRSPSHKYKKSLTKFSDDKINEEIELDIINKRRASHGLKNVKNIKDILKEEKNKKLKEEEKQSKSEEPKKSEEEERKIEEQKRKEEEEEDENKKKIEEENIKKQSEKKKKINPSKSQFDISPDFIIKKLDEKIEENTQATSLKISDRESKKIFRIESICKKGFSGPGVKKVNQDNFFIYNNFVDNPSYIFLGVCDGHGLYGQDVSNYLVSNLPKNLNNCLLKLKINDIINAKFDEISRIISQIFVQTDTDLIYNEKVESNFSGSTCSALIYSPERLISANVGDSRCVLGKFDGKNWTYKNLTRDHKPSEPDENKRIIDNGGRVQSFKDEDGEFEGPERVWLKNEEVPGLAMSRSFGDEIAHTVGVTAEPEVFDYYFLHEDKFVILASDGIWEFISSEECINIVKDYYLRDDIDGALSYLFKESSKRWIMEEEVIDDITIIILFLN